MKLEEEDREQLVNQIQDTAAALRAIADSAVELSKRVEVGDVETKDQYLEAVEEVFEEIDEEHEEALGELGIEL